MAGEYRFAVTSLWLAGVGFSVGICYSALGFQGSGLWKEESGNFMQEWPGAATACIYFLCGRVCLGMLVHERGLT